MKWLVSTGSGRGLSKSPALDLCVRCPVNSRCLDAALVKPEWSLGMWAGTTGSERAEMAKVMRRVVTDGTDIRSEPFFTQFADDADIVRDVTVAVEAPAHLAAILSARADLPVIAAVALAGRHDGAISATLARRGDLPEWLRVMALGNDAIDASVRRLGEVDVADEGADEDEEGEDEENEDGEENEERWLLCEEPAGLLLDEVEEVG